MLFTVANIVSVRRCHRVPDGGEHEPEDEVGADHQQDYETPFAVNLEDKPYVN